MTPVLEIARAYLRRGWAPIPVPFRRKRCVLDGWERLRISEPELTRYFNGELQNIGVLLGDVSGGLVDIDLDAPEALALAAAFLPNTDARFGRAGKPESHWLYVVAIAPETVAFRDPEAGLADGKSMVVEIRSQHVQTVFPGSVHESGEPIVWSAAGEPARVEAATLWTTVRRLAAAALLGRHWPPAGGRHEASLATAGLLLRGGVDEATTAQIIQSAARVAGDEEWRERPKDVVTTAARLARGESATGAPRLATVLRGEGAKVVHRLREWLGLRLPRPHLTDAGNAERFAGQHREDVRYVYAWRCWLFWDGTRWRRDAGDIAMRLAKETVRTIYSEAAAESDAEERKRIAAWAKLSESEPRLRAMLALAQSEPGIPVTPAELDRDPFLLNCPNGTLELRTMALRLHRREDLLTKLAAARFDPDARHPTWTAFLERVLPTPALRTFVQRVAGYCLTGDTSDEKFFFAHGPTGGGKSTLLGALRRTWGNYATTADFSTFTVHRHQDRPREDIARLHGSRLVVSVEVTDGTRLAEGLVKTLTGGDHVAARFLYERTFEFLPQFKLCIAANNRPTVRDDDDAMWRRLVEIPFPQSLPEEERDPSVKATLMDPSIAGPAILAWAAEGAASWFVDGLGKAEEVDQATKDYRAEMDPLREFWRERCVFDPAAFIASRALYAAYDAWVAEKRIRQSLTRAELRNRLHAKGCQPHRTTSLRGWKGLLLRAGSDPLDAEAD